MESVKLHITEELKILRPQRSNGEKDKIMYKTKEKLYEAGKNEFLKIFDEIPEIDECEFFEVKDSCDELYYDFSTDADGELIDDAPKIKTVEWTRDYCLQYKDTIYYDSMKEEITMTIRYDEDGRLTANVGTEVIRYRYNSWEIEREDK